METDASVKVISFDLFDTLVTRPFDHPDTLFALLEIKARLPGFADKRRQAQHEARRLSGGEITLDDIYKLMPPIFQRVKSDEMALEIVLCAPDAQMSLEYWQAAQSGKRVVIATDMYLPRETILAIIKKCGYEAHERVFISGEMHKSKKDGALYEAIALEMGVAPNEILHIGDNPVSDMESARRQGVKTMLYRAALDVYGKVPCSALFGALAACSETAASVAAGLIVRKNQQKREGYTEWTYLGYDLGGLIVLGFMRWLHDRINYDSCDGLFFLARDGWILQQAYALLYPNEKTTYMHASRRMFLLAGSHDMRDAVPQLAGRGTITRTYGEVLSRIFLESSELETLAAQEFNLNERIETPQQRDAIASFLLRHNELLLREAKAEKELVLRYLRDIGFMNCKKPAIVDLGWQGTQQKFLQPLVGVNGPHIKGYYLGNVNAENDAICAFFHGDEELKTLTHYFVTDVLELLLSAPHPCCVKLREQGGVPVPVYGEVTQGEAARHEYTKDICTGTLDFIRDFTQVEAAAGIEISVPQNAAFPIASYLKNSVSPSHRELLENVAYFGGVGNDTYSRPMRVNGGIVFGIRLPCNPSAQDIERADLICAAAGRILTRCQTVTGKSNAWDERPDFVICLGEAMENVYLSYPFAAAFGGCATYEDGILKLIENHGENVRAFREKIYAPHQRLHVLLAYQKEIIVFDDAAAKTLMADMQEIEAQHYQNVTLGIACSREAMPSVRSFAATRSARVKPLPAALNVLPDMIPHDLCLPFCPYQKLLYGELDRQIMEMLP